MNTDFEKFLLLCESTEDNGYIANLKRRYREINKVRRSLRLSLQKQEDAKKKECVKELADTFHQFQNIQRMFDSSKDMSSDGMSQQYVKELTDIFHQLRNVQRTFDSSKDIEVLRQYGKELTGVFRRLRYMQRAFNSLKDTSSKKMLQQYVKELADIFNQFQYIQREFDSSEDTHSKVTLRQYDKELTDIFHQLRNVQTAFDSLKDMSSEERTELISKIESRIEQLYSERMPTTERGSTKHNAEIDAKIEKLVFFGQLMKDVVAKIEKQKSAEEPISKPDIAAPAEPEKNIEKQRDYEERNRENDRRDRIEQLRQKRRQKDEEEIAQNINIPASDFDDDEFAAMLKSFGVREEANRREQERSIHPIPSEQPEEIRKKNFPDGYKWQSNRSGKEFVSPAIRDRRGHLIKSGQHFPAGRFVPKESYDTNDAIWNTLMEFTEYRRWKMRVDD